MGRARLAISGEEAATDSCFQALELRELGFSELAVNDAVVDVLVSTSHLIWSGQQYEHSLQFVWGLCLSCEFHSSTTSGFGVDHPEQFTT